MYGNTDSWQYPGGSVGLSIGTELGDLDGVYGGLDGF